MTFQDSLANSPDPEVVPKAKRRKFSAGYKLRILGEADNCTAPPVCALARWRGNLVRGGDISVYKQLCAKDR